MQETLSIIIPAFNEEEGLPQVLSELKTLGGDPLQGGLSTNIEIIVVDDGSTDRTAELAAAHEGVSVIRHGKRKGYGAALKAGLLHSRGDYLGFVDADGTYPARMFQVLLDGIRGKDIDLVIGSRLGHSGNGMPFSRKIGNIFFAALLSWLADRKVGDTASGMRVFRRACLNRLLPLPDGLDFTPTMTARALHENMRILEIPIPYHERLGRSKLNVIRDGLRFLRSIVGVSRLYNPSKFFGLAGLIMITSAVALGLQPLLYYMVVRRVEDWTIYRLFTVMVLLVTGVNFVSFGVFSGYILALIRGERPPSERRLNWVSAGQLILRHADWIGAGFILFSVILNRRTILEYVTTRHIYVHWSYILTGATFFLIGVQFIMSGFLIRAVQSLKEYLFTATESPERTAARDPEKVSAECETNEQG